MKRRLSDADEFVSNKRRKIVPEVEKQLIDDLIRDIKTDEECTADEETLLTSDDEDQVKQLLDRLPDLNNRFGYVKQTPLMIVIENGMTDLAEYLIKEKKVDLAVLDDNRQSALHYAAENGEDDIACLIVDQKRGDIEYLDQSDGDAMTPLMFAVQKHCTKTVAKLLAAKVSWEYKYDEDNQTMNVLLEVNDKETLLQFQAYTSQYWDSVEKPAMKNALVNRALEIANLELLKEFLPQYALDNYFHPYDDDSGEKDSWDEVDDDKSPDPLALAIMAGDEEILRYLHDRKAWFKNLGHIAVDTDDMNIVKLMHEFKDLGGDKKSLQKTVEAAIENDNYEMLEYLLTEADLVKEFEIEEARISLEGALLCPESSSYARLLASTQHAELPGNLQSYDMNPFAQDFHDRYLRSHIFGPVMAWCSPQEANFVRDFSQGSHDKDDTVADKNANYLTHCSEDSKRIIFGYLNCLEDIISVMFTCKQFGEIINSQEYWKTQWFETYEMAVIEDSGEVDWKTTFIAMDKLLKSWTLEENCRIARVCVLGGSYNYEVRDKDGTTSIKTVEPHGSHFITCGLDQEINFKVEQSPLPMNKIKQFLPNGQIELVDYDCFIE